MSRRRALVAALLALAVPAARERPRSARGHDARARRAAGACARAEVTLRFGEPVEASFGAVRVFDARGREVQAGAARHPGGDIRPLSR